MLRGQRWFDGLPHLRIPKTKNGNTTKIVFTYQCLTDQRRHKSRHFY